MANAVRVVSDRRYTFAVDPDQFWTLIAEVDSYRRVVAVVAFVRCQRARSRRTLAVHRATSRAVPGPLHA